MAMAMMMIIIIVVMMIEYDEYLEGVFAKEPSGGIILVHKTLQPLCLTCARNQTTPKALSSAARVQQRGAHLRQET